MVCESAAILSRPQCIEDVFKIVHEFVHRDNDPSNGRQRDMPRYRLIYPTLFEIIIGKLSLNK